MSSGRGGKTSRSYRPTVEALEALRLLSGATQALPGPAYELGLRDGATTTLPALHGHDLAWDEVLADSQVADLLSPARGSALAVAPAARQVDASDVADGLSQLNRYLARAWYRAGVPPQMHEDCSQAVFVSLLQTMGRDRFDQLVGDVGLLGIREALSKDSDDGPDFFRAIDMVKKRAQRERSYQPLDTIDIASSAPGDGASEDWRGALREAIDHSLTPREASLVRETLMGKTPAEIAATWGVAPKTVSNEKTRVLAKLREALVADLDD